MLVGTKDVYHGNAVIGRVSGYLAHNANNELGATYHYAGVAGSYSFNIAASRMVAYFEHQGAAAPVATPRVQGRLLATWSGFPTSGIPGPPYALVGSNTPTVTKAVATIVANNKDNEIEIPFTMVRPQQLGIIHVVKVNGVERYRSIDIFRTEHASSDEYLYVSPTEQMITYISVQPGTAQNLQPTRWTTGITALQSTLPAGLTIEIYEAVVG